MIGKIVVVLQNGRGAVGSHAATSLLPVIWQFFVYIFSWTMGRWCKWDNPIKKLDFLLSMEKEICESQWAIIKTLSLISDYVHGFGAISQ